MLLLLPAPTGAQGYRNTATKWLTLVHVGSLHVPLTEASAITAVLQAPTGAQGFRNTATKWLTLVHVGILHVPLSEASATTAVLQAPTGAQGFRNTATKWLTLVRLLLGEVPAHQDLKGAGVERSLAPYFQLSQAVRLGDLNAFKYALFTILARSGHHQAFS